MPNNMSLSNTITILNTKYSLERYTRKPRSLNKRVFEKALRKKLTHRIYS